MKLDPQRRRNSLRWPGYDYRQMGVVYVTICVHKRQRLFGSVNNERVTLSLPGQFVLEAWEIIPIRFFSVTLDAYVVMPDHLHGVLVFEPNALGELAPSVGDVVRSFKSTVLSVWKRGVITEGWPPYHGRLWQDRFYDHVVRNEHDLDRLRTYIVGNPIAWSTDHDGDWMPEDMEHL